MAFDQVRIPPARPDAARMNRLSRGRRLIPVLSLAIHLANGQPPRSLRRDVGQADKTPRWTVESASGGQTFNMNYDQAREPSSRCFRFACRALVKCGKAGYHQSPKEHHRSLKSIIARTYPRGLWRAKRAA